MILLEKVQKSFEGVNALGPITMQYQTGKTHVVLGTSGCGKTTLLKAIMGLIPLDQGRILYDDAAQVPRYGYLMQKGGLFPHLTLLDNITLASRCHGKDARKTEEKMQALLDLVDLSPDMLGRYPDEISGGQKQRFSLVRALMLDPEYVFLDEPFGALDPITKAMLQEELKRIFNALQKTVVLVTHDLAVSAYFGHTVTLLQNGQLEQCGSFEDLVDQPASEYVSKFISSYRNIPLS